MIKKPSENGHRKQTVDSHQKYYKWAINLRIMSFISNKVKQILNFIYH